MLSENQPFIKDVCEKCGMELWDCRDWTEPRWEDPYWDECDHRAANDPELLEIEKDLDEIIERINCSTAAIRYYEGLNEHLPTIK